MVELPAAGPNGRYAPGQKSDPRATGIDVGREGRDVEHDQVPGGGPYLSEGFGV